MKIALLEQEENKLVKRNAYRLKVIEQLSERCHMQETELARLNSFYGERRKYEARIARLEAEIDELHKALGDGRNSLPRRTTSCTVLYGKIGFDLAPMFHDLFYLFICVQKQS